MVKNSEKLLRRRRDPVTLDDIVEAIAEIRTQGEATNIYIHPDTQNILLTDVNVLAEGGIIKSILGLPVIVSKTIDKNKAFLVSQNLWK